MRHVSQFWILIRQHPKMQTQKWWTVISQAQAYIGTANDTEPISSPEISKVQLGEVTIGLDVAEVTLPFIDLGTPTVQARVDLVGSSYQTTASLPTLHDINNIVWRCRGILDWALDFESKGSGFDSRPYLGTFVLQQGTLSHIAALHPGV